MKNFIQKLPNEKRIYMKIAFFAALLHIAYIGIFTYFSIKPMIIYNVASMLLYFGLIFAINKELYRLAVITVHIEVAVFVTVSSLFGGFSLGMGMYLLAMASMIYICPFKHKSVPYILSVFDALMYIVLRICVNLIIPHGLQDMSIYESTFLHTFNAACSFLIIFFAAIFTDADAVIAKKKLLKENRKLEAIANYDDLTGLQSRYFFSERADKIPNDAEVSVAIGDIDDFKEINDTYGHICGDYVLQAVAELMRRSLDPGRVDICRWGGEEFLCLFHEDSFGDAFARLEELRKRIEDYQFEYQDKKFRLTMTFGLVSGKGFGLEMIDAADQRLYEGKNSGKNKVVS